MQTALEERGHTVQLFQQDSREWHTLSLFGKAARAVQIPYSLTNRASLIPHIKSFAPDVLHVHNIFPFLSPSIYDAARENGVPVVHTLHNYRLFCMNGLLFRDGHPCELCVNGGTWHGFINGCYQKSRINSAAMALNLGVHRALNTWARKVDRFIVLSNFSRDMYIRAGFPDDKLVVLPNPIEPSDAPSSFPGTSFLYMGRLSHEKGILTLLDAFLIHSIRDPEAILNIAGDGPLLDTVKNFQRNNPHVRIRLYGFVSGMEKERLLSDARYVVFPSECYENCPYGLLESLSRGIPVIASNRGAIPEIIRDEQSGWLFEPGSPESLASVLAKATSHPHEKELEMRRFAWAESRQRFAPQEWINQIENLYHSLPAH
jgi:glycosyltransferase involved in cell wall biosynthesis